MFLIYVYGNFCLEYLCDSLTSIFMLLRIFIGCKKKKKVEMYFVRKCVIGHSSSILEVLSNMCLAKFGIFAFSDPSL